MEEIVFEVQGSALKPYRVVFVRRSQTNMSAYCFCPAGENGQYCKHRIAILDGTEKDFFSANPDDVKIVQSWLSGTDIETALLKMRVLQKQSEQIKRELSSAKNELAKAMRD